MTSKPYAQNIQACEADLVAYGDSARGVGWKTTDADARYRVMLDVIRPGSSPCTLLDFGCGASHLYEYILRQKINGVSYEGLDLSDKFLALSKDKFPNTVYHKIDILDNSNELPDFDYIVMNGIFTYRGSMPNTDMFDYMCRIIERIFDTTRIGLAFNVMSKQVDWERNDLFHVPIDEILNFLSRKISRHVVVRHDYGLYEYTVYVYRQANDQNHFEAERLVE